MARGRPQRGGRGPWTTFYTVTCLRWYDTPAWLEGDIGRAVGADGEILRPLPSSEVLETATASAWSSRPKASLADAQNATAFEAVRGPAPFSLASVRRRARGAERGGRRALEAATAPGSRGKRRWREGARGGACRVSRAHERVVFPKSGGRCAGRGLCSCSSVVHRSYASSAN